MPKQSAIATVEIANLVQQVREIILSARARAAQSVDAIQIAMNFAIGQRIVEHEQGGDKRAAYGKRVVESLAKSMTSEFGRGFSATNLKLMRQFYCTYASRIGQTPSGFLLSEIGQIPSGQSGGTDSCSENASAQIKPLAGLASNKLVALRFSDGHQ